MITLAAAERDAVIVACAIVGLYLYANDLVWKRVLQNVFLGQ